MSDGTTHWNGTTHYAGCIQSGKEHYECALQEIGRLRLTITHLRAELEKAQFSYERGFDDGFILRKEKDEGAKSEYICTCGIRVTPHKCPTNDGF
jgi:hypothetical protein